MTGGYSRHYIIAGGTSTSGDITLDGPEVAMWAALEIQKFHGKFKPLLAGKGI